MLGNMLTRKGLMTVRVWVNGQKLLVPIHLLSNIEITNYFNNEPTFNGVYSRDNLQRLKMENMP